MEAKSAAAGVKLSRQLIPHVLTKFGSVFFVLHFSIRSDVLLVESFLAFSL